MNQLFSRFAVFAMLVGAFPTQGCKQEASPDAARVPKATGASAGTGGATDSGERSCPTDLPGAKLIRIERSDGRAACIDQREVSQAEYHTFITAIGDRGLEKMGFCTAYHESFYWDRPEPNQGAADNDVYGYCPVGAYQPSKTPDAPAGCLDHCQAESYCAWAGKELCGGFDDDKPLDERQASDPQVSIWASACTNGGQTESSHVSKDPSACGKHPSPREAETHGVMEYPECHGQGPYEAIFGLSGGVAEWVNAQRPPAEEGAAPSSIRMGPSWAVAGDPACGRSNLGGLHWSSGFRCCKRLPR